MITVRVFLAEDEAPRVDFFHEIDAFEFEGFRFDPYLIHRFDKQPDRWVQSFLDWDGPAILFLDFDLRFILDNEAMMSRLVGLRELRESRKEAEKWFVPSYMSESTAIALTRLKKASSQPFLLVGASSYVADEPWAAIRSNLPESSTVSLDYLRQRFPGRWPRDLGIELYRHSTIPIAAYRGRRFQRDQNLFPEAQHALTEAALIFVWAFSEEGDLWDLDIRDWQTFRDLLWQESSQWSKRGIGPRHERWAHHLRGGGYEYDPELLPTILFDYFLATARRVAPRFNASRMAASQLEWCGLRDDRHSPWRAACQFDGGGRDLTNALQTIKQAQCETIDVVIAFKFDDRLAIFGDCLWCNGVGIARHIRRIAKCFADLIRLRGEQVRGVFNVAAFLEYRVDPTVMLRLCISQSVNDVLLPLPVLTEATGKIFTSYAALRQCGADLGVDEVGALSIVINGKIENRVDAEGNLVPVFTAYS